MYMDLIKEMDIEILNHVDLMTMKNIAVDRLYSQQFEHSRLKLPGEVVVWLGAIQAQDYAGAKWSVGLRLPGSTDAAIEQAIEDRAIIRTWAMRGTLHFVAASDIRWMLALMAPRIITNNARRYMQLGLDEPTLARSNEVLVDALQGGKQLTRKELLPILRQKGISTEGQRAPYMLQRASLDGLICQGVVHRNDPTYMLLDGAIPKGRRMERDEALVELAKRYFTSRGPATLQDYVWWSGLTAADSKAGLEAIESQLISETIDRQTYWRSSSLPAGQESSPTVYLLPGFDEYLLSYRDRSASLDVERIKKLTPTNGMLNPTIVIGGWVVGTWNRTFRKGEVVITAKPFTALTSDERQDFDNAARRYGEYLGMAVVLH